MKKPKYWSDAELERQAENAVAGVVYFLSRRDIRYGYHTVKCVEADGKRTFVLNDEQLYVH